MKYFGSAKVKMRTDNTCKSKNQTVLKRNQKINLIMHTI